MAKEKKKATTERTNRQSKQRKEEKMHYNGTGQQALT